MSPTNLEQAREAVANARSALLNAYRTLGVHEASYSAYPGHGEASDSIERALREAERAEAAL